MSCCGRIDLTEKSLLVQNCKTNGKLFLFDGNCPCVGGKDLIFAITQK